MAKNLVIVESPSKAKTIEKFLGKDFHVVSSYGHVRDLEKNSISIDLEHGFEPLYVVSDDKLKIVKQLKDEVKRAEIIWLASDEDREGEAIAWHLFEELSLKDKDTKRIVFNEITKKAILAAIEHPRDIDQNLVNAQQARRILDRIVGYEISPILWRKVKPKLSAGRVQSVAVKLIVEREQEIKDFQITDFYNVKALFLGKSSAKLIGAMLNKKLKTKDEVLELLNDCNKATFTATSVEKKPSKRSPAPPFTTSTLQQEASRKIGFSVDRTMALAQQLYEAGLITYMRTDSVNLSDEAVGMAKSFIENEYGAKYAKPRRFKNKIKGAQEAHEAIRPTDLFCRTIDEDKSKKSLYELIWKRTIASQMSDAQIEQTTVEIEISNREELFIAKGEVILFDGFLVLYSASEETDEQVADKDSSILPLITKDEILKLDNAKAKQTFTIPPARYGEAMLVSKLEDLGIGRPSTYAPTISTIQKREYVTKGQNPAKTRNVIVITLKNSTIKESEEKEGYGSEKGKLLPTDIGTVVNSFLCQHFTQIMDYNFTASVEKEFDSVALGKEEWKNMLEAFYSPFHAEVETTGANSEKAKAERLLGEDPKTGRKVFAKIGRFGAMIQIGETSDEEKPKFASLKADQSVLDISFEDALKLFDLPRSVGEYEKEEIVVATGRFGPYLKFGKKNISLPKSLDPFSISLDECIAIIKEKNEKESRIKEVLSELPKTLGEISGKAVELKSGKYGIYLSYDGKNYRVSQSENFSQFDLAAAKEVINSSKKK
jgi:DNA topoisomerase-1